jgi:transcriptional regulator with XRE-family HTH domain
MPVTIDLRQLGAELKRKRDERDLSLRDVSTETDISAATLSRIERGSGIPELPIIEKLAQWLDVSVRAAGVDDVRVSTDEDVKRLIAVHLRANKKLPEVVARAIADAYDAVLRYHIEEHRTRKKKS